MTIFTANWQGLSNGAAWPSPWAFLQGGSGGAADAQGERGRLLTGTNDFNYFRASRAAAYEDATIEFDFEMVESTNGWIRTCIRTPDDHLTVGPQPANGYFLEISRALNQALLVIRINSSSNWVGSITGLDLANVRYRVKCLVVGNNIKVKVWPYNDTEPSAWGMDVTDQANAFPTSSSFFLTAQKDTAAGRQDVRFESVSVTAVGAALTPLSIAIATDFGASAVPAQSWFDDAFAAGYEGFITTTYTNWGGNPQPWLDSHDAFQKALNAGLWIGAYGRPVSRWFEALDHLPTAILNELKFFALDVETEPDGVHPLEHEYYDGVYNTFGVRPVVYTTPGEWESIMGTASTVFAYMHLWEYAGDKAQIGSLSEYPIWSYSGWNVNAPAIWTTGGYSAGDVVPNVQNRRIAQQNDVAGHDFNGINVLDEHFLKPWIDGDLPAPTNVQVTPDGGNADVTWDAVTGALSYDILRNNVIIASQVTSTSYTDTNVSQGVEYRYRVRARFDRGDDI